VSLRYDEIAEILKLIDSSSCDEFIVETAEIKLIVRRNGATGHAELLSDRPRPVALSAVHSAVREVASPKAEAAAGQIEVTAPMVGTFFRAPSPDAQPFVEIGSTVKKGQPLCLIEVMKLFTTINSEIDCRVVQIGAENGELVEYGQTMFVVEPN
jgi:acetyl-CoA carboxylase biotin carboxyl carrier protein